MVGDLWRTTLVCLFCFVLICCCFLVCVLFCLFACFLFVFAVMFLFFVFVVVVFCMAAQRSVWWVTLSWLDCGIEGDHWQIWLYCRAGLCRAIQDELPYSDLTVTWWETTEEPGCVFLQGWGVTNKLTTLDCDVVGDHWGSWLCFLAGLCSVV